MSTHYEDKNTEVSTYRALLLGIHVGLALIIVIVVAAAFPDIHWLVMCLLCLGLTLVLIAVQFWDEHNHISSGESFVEDGEDLYIALGIFGLNLGRRFTGRMASPLKSYRYFWVEEVESYKDRFYGIYLKAKVYTATSAQVELTQEMFDTPGTVRDQLRSEGKEQTRVFHIEHNLRSNEEKRLLQRFGDLQKGNK